MLDIGKASRERLSTYKRGVYLETRFGKSIDDLKIDACLARWALAIRFLQYARKADAVRPRQNRLVIGRSYYCMYHAARAVVFHFTGGDDHEAHSALPNALPTDFPNRQAWLNQLRTARLERNRADYDPYPKTENAFSTQANTTFTQAGLFVVEAKNYLLGKNVPL